MARTEASRQFDEFREVRERARNHQLEFFRGLPQLSSFTHDLHVLKLKFDHRLAKEGRFLVITVEQNNARMRPHQRKRNSRKPCAAAYIDERRRLQMRQNRE